MTMFTLDHIECSSLTSPLSLSLFLASQVTSSSSSSHLRLPHHHHHRPILDDPLRSTVHFSPRTRFTHSPLTLTHSPPRLKNITACSHHSSAPVPDRLISAALYSLTFLGGIGYGSHRIPPTLYPRIFYQYNSSMLTRVVSFYVVLLFVVRNPRLSKYVRINALQTILLDAVLQMPLGLLLKVILPVWPVGVMIAYDFMFILVVFGFVHIMVNTILGKTPQFPLITDAAGIHLRGL